VLGNKVTASIDIVDDSHADIDITVKGIVNVNINCKSEEYVLSGSKVTLPGIGNADDCIGKDLKENGVDLKSITYDSGKNSIEISVHKIINIVITLTHKSD